MKKLLLLLVLLAGCVERESETIDVDSNYKEIERLYGPAKPIVSYGTVKEVVLYGKKCLLIERYESTAMSCDWRKYD